MSIPIIVPTQYHQLLDWFIVLNEGRYNYTGPGSFNPYIYLDNFDFRKSPCTSCDPNGLISWNWTTPRPYLSPNGDGIFDEVCITNINNVSWYEFFVFDRWGVTVHQEIASNPNGYENLSLCWDGRDLNGDMLQIPNYYPCVLRLGNCGTQITKWYNFWTTHDLLQDTFSIAPNYVPPLFGLETPPTHYRNLHLYGGTYWGTHDWYACDTIFVGGYGAPRVPYFISGSTANLGMYAGEGIWIDSLDSDLVLGGDVDMQVIPVQCCPALRLAHPDSGITPANVETVPTEPNDRSVMEGDMELSPWNGDQHPSTSTVEAMTLEIDPNPADGMATVHIHIPEGETATVEIWTANGERVAVLNGGRPLSSGDQMIEVQVETLPAGLYMMQAHSARHVVGRRMVVAR